ncbi:MAG: hypothetical protein ACREBG_29715 [Pyrinomonadaceae bacterium]
MRNVRSVCVFTLIIALLVLSVTVFAQRKTQRVRFPRGRTTAVLHGAVVRGTNDRYILGARSGQTMIVHLSSREKNAVFTILGPDATALPGTEEGLDVSDWTGELPLTGDYSIWVSPMRGNATYTLEVTIR